jgi:Tfp pilus assembly protein PilO
MTQKSIRPAFLIPACILLVFLLYYKAFFSPVLKDILSDEREISELRASLTALRSKSEEMEGLSKNLADLESLILNKKASLPDKLDSYDIILLLSRIDNAAIIKNSLIFLDPIEQEDFIILPVRIQFTANYYGLLEFLSFLDSLEAQPSVSNIQISTASAEKNTRSSMDESGEVIYNLDVTMTLNFYTERD